MCGFLIKKPQVSIYKQIVDVTFVKEISPLSFLLYSLYNQILYSRDNLFLIYVLFCNPPQEYPLVKTINIETGLQYLFHLFKKTA